MFGYTRYIQQIHRQIDAPGTFYDYKGYYAHGRTQRTHGHAWTYGRTRTNARTSCCGSQTSSIARFFLPLDKVQLMLNVHSFIDVLRKPCRSLREKRNDDFHLSMGEHRWREIIMPYSGTYAHPDLYFVSPVRHATTSQPCVYSHQ